MKNHKDVEAFLLGLPGAHLDYPFGEGTAVYKDSNDKMFALISENTNPLQLHLKGDPQLNELLRDKYESVLPGWHLNKKHWNTVLLTGQLSDDEIKDLINHSFNLVSTKTD